MSVRGDRVNWESLNVGERYILKTSGKQEALVKVTSTDITGIVVTIEDGSIRSLKQAKTFKKGDHYTADPSYAEFFEPTE